MHRSPAHFCRSVERVAGLAAVSAEWRRALADDWPWARALLRATGALADCFPKLDDAPASPAAYRVVWRDAAADRYVASCPAGTGSVELCRADLAVHELDVRELARRLASAMGVVCDYGDVEGVPHATRVGARDPLADGETWVYLALQADARQLADTLAGLAVRHDRPFLLLTPTRAHWRTWPEGLRARAEVLALDEAFVVAADGRWLTADRAPAAPRPAALLVSPPPPAPSRRRGPTELPDRNEMVVLRILAGARALMVQEEITAATKEAGRRLARHTVGKVLKGLAGRGLVEYPPGTRRGARITEAGRSLADSAVDPNP